MKTNQNTNRARKTKIEWTGRTWNPLRGCSRISEGCTACYAEAFAERFRGVKGHPYEQGFDLRLVPHKLPEPLAWDTPSTVFVNSMSDLFHKDVPVDYIVLVCFVMGLANWHTYQVLTKRADRMRDLLRGPLRFAAELDNVWWGVSVENRKHGLPRVDVLRDTPARVRFLSVEPLLEDLGPDADLTTGIDWVIVGGESGRKPRPLDPAWVQTIRDRCLATNVPFFFKQWGGTNKKVTGRLLDGRTHDDMPACVRRNPPARSARLASIDCVVEASRAFMAATGPNRLSLPLVEDADGHQGTGVA